MAERCCRCMKTGSCIRCSCAVSGTVCTECYPSTKGRCQNQPLQLDPEHDLNTNMIQSPPHEAVDRLPLQSSNMLSLPGFIPKCELRFLWGCLEDINGDAVCEVIDSVYNEVVNWKPNLFKIPLGNCGKSFTAELSRLFMGFVSWNRLYSTLSLSCLHSYFKDQVIFSNSYHIGS